MLVKRIYTRSILVFVFSILLTMPVHSVEIPHGAAVPAEAILSEVLTSSVLSYYKGEPFETFSIAAFQAVMGDTAIEDFGTSTLYMGMIAGSTYLFGSLLGHKGSVGMALGGAYFPPVALYTLTGTFTMSYSKAVSAGRLGIGLAPIASAAAYHWSTSFSGFGENRENSDFVAAQILGSYYGMAIANIGLESLSIGLRSEPAHKGGLCFLSSTALGISGGLSAYGIGELRGSGDGTLHGTLLSGFAASAIGTTVGALINNRGTGGSHWLEGYYLATLTSTDTAAPLGYGLFQPKKDHGKLAQVMGGYYGSAIVGSGMDLLSRRRYISDEKFALARATAMSLAGGFGAYGVGDYWGEGDGRLGRTILGSFTAPISGFALTSYVGVPEGYDEMYRVASFLSPLTAMTGYHFPSDDFRSSEDNGSVFAAEVLGGYLGGGIVALGLNHTGYDLEEAGSDWRRSLVRCTVLPLASACIVYALGEEYGSGQGAFADSLKGSFIAPVGLGALPVALGALRGLGYTWNTKDFLSISEYWNETSLIGVFFSPVLAAHFYSSGADSTSPKKKAVSDSPKPAPRPWQVIFPLSQIRF